MHYIEIFLYLCTYKPILIFIMKARILLTTLFLMCVSQLWAQDQIKTYSVYDVNHNDSVTVVDATKVVSRAIKEIVDDPQMVDAAVIKEILQAIYDKIDTNSTSISTIENKLGFGSDSSISTQGTVSYDDFGGLVIGGTLVRANGYLGVKEGTEITEFYYSSVKVVRIERYYGGGNPNYIVMPNITKIAKGCFYRREDGGPYYVWLKKGAKIEFESDALEGVERIYYYDEYIPKSSN